MADETTDLPEIVRGIRRRASFARLSALAIIFVLTVIGVGTAIVFLQVWNSPSIIIGPGTNLAQAKIKLGGELDWIQELTKAFVRVGGVIMAVFLINILVSFARYNMRVANYLDSRADVIAMTKGDIEIIAKLLPAISVDPLDFIKVPLAPYDTYLDVIRGVLPGRTAGRGRPPHPGNPEG